MVLRYTAIVIITACCYILVSSFSGGGDAQAGKVIEKKVSGALDRLWPGVKLTREPLPAAFADLNIGGATNLLFLLRKDQDMVGYLYMGDAPSKFDQFDYMVVFNPDLTILTSQILLYREEYGGEIASYRWLKQFNGKKNGKNMEIGQDIQGISGATISVKSFSHSIKMVSLKMKELKETGVI